MSADVKRGDVRRHKRWIEPKMGGGVLRDEQGKPVGALVRVTAVRNGVVFYGFGAEATKGRYYIGVEGFLANTEPVE